MKVRVMVFPGAQNLPLWLMNDIELHYTKSRDEQITALQSGAVDVIHTSPDNLLLPDATGLAPFLAGTVGPLDLVATETTSTPILAVDNPHSGFGRLAYQWLRHHAPKLNYTVLAAGGTPQRFAALQMGQASMAVMHPPFTQFCLAAGYTVLGRIDVGYATLCGACRSDLLTSDLVHHYHQGYQDAIAKLAGPEGPSTARKTLAENVPDLTEPVRQQIADIMRAEVVEAGVEFDSKAMERLQELPR